MNGVYGTIRPSNINILQDVEMFKDSISTATPKYVTVNKEGEKLPYQQMEYRRFLD